MKHLNSIGELDMCYLVLNNLEISNFDSNILSIVGEVSSTAVVKIIKLMSKFNTSIKIEHEKENHSNNKFSFKKILIDRIKLSDSWNLIISNFPGAKISDIIINDDK